MVRRALVDAQASGLKSPFISTTFNEAKAIDKFRRASAEFGGQWELLKIRGPRSGGIDFNRMFELLGGRTKRFGDADLDEFGIFDLFIPGTGKSRSGFEILEKY